MGLGQMIETNQLKNIVAFCILMEYRDGILFKSPEYIVEKFERYCETKNEDQTGWGLDHTNRTKLSDWIDRWLERKKSE